MNALKTALFVAMLLGRTLPNQPSLEGELQRAIQKLSMAENFSWVAMTIEEKDGKDPKVAETLEGKWDKNGWCQLSNPKSKNAGDAFLKGDRIAVLLQECWKVLDVKEAALAAGKPDKTIRQAQQFLKSKSPSEELRSYLGRVEDLRLGKNGLYSGRYTALDVPIIIERAQAAGRKIPDFVEPAARINFRIENGVLASFELVISGREAKAKKGQVVETLLAMSIDFSGVGTTALEIPAEVRKLLE